MDKKIIAISSIAAMPCNWSVGKNIQRFLEGLADGKVTGIKCGGCGKVYVPPQQLCGDCFKVMEEWIELSGRGQVVNYTVAHVDVRNGPLKEPQIIGMIKFDGADTAVFGRIVGAKAGPELIGLKVKPAFRDERKGSIRDITHYEPV